ncbi:FMN-binding glutamate synthase family protein [Adhaeretor mobilis]|uniref:Glutamate synthase [NADPH] large chain n=1 Tax=Adhaeretor mobilis TaxID=1930276 RepID=A0A517MSS2_9BACT|nr:FMN-binding glutamate synthase family protein [Adhaeretor mobilis]QDS97934.1 Glutamate synthase [NADPH] large chain [Adhaeretor mobilis]
MLRPWFYGFVALTLGVQVLFALFWPTGLWSLVVLVPVIGVGIYDVLQRDHTILRNFPVLGHGRYLMEKIRPEIQQYFIETNIAPHPIARELRAVVYQRAKGQLETKPFGTEHNVYNTGYEWAAHSLACTECPDDRTQEEKDDGVLLDGEQPLIAIGGPDCKRPYESSLLNISAMSFGSLSPTAIRALNRGASLGKFAHNTGEGGISPYHLEAGGDLIWQIGTGYFGCRADDGGFDSGKYRETVAAESVKMVELKLSQGAKPGHGGVLPGEKVSPEIASIRGVPVGKTVVSPPRHSAFKTPIEMLHFVATLRELADGRPVGFKLCMGKRSEFLAVCKAMLETQIMPDFITVDGGEGGTGAAPIEFSNSVGMPAQDGWLFAHNALVGSGLRDKITLIGSGKILTGFDMVRAFALGIDACNSARGMMFALGCIQALRCDSGHCPTGIATQQAGLFRGLDPTDKGERVRRFHARTIESLREMLHAMGARTTRDVTPEMLFRRIDRTNVCSLADLYEFLEEGQLHGNEVPQPWQKDWERASAQTFA